MECSNPTHPSQYVGRFAPSPTGPLHFGSLLAALGSCLEARRHAGQWLLRIEDVDTPRSVAGATDSILFQLETFGFEWDGEIAYQSQRLQLYQHALAQLAQAGRVFPCACTRKELADSSLAPDGSRRYPGTCRDGLRAGQSARAWRFKTEPGGIVWQDAIQGAQHEDVFQEVGDFVLLRADGQYAYQLAVVVDDAAQGVSHIVRGADLLGSTARQMALYHALGEPIPSYAHLPVATNEAGEKLSKQTLARALDTKNPANTLFHALQFLGQTPHATLARASLSEIWAWSRANWSLAAIPRQFARVAPAQMLGNTTAEA